MKNLKNIIVYGIIIVLCIIVIGGYFLEKGNRDKATVIDTSISTQNTEAKSAGSDAQTTAEAVKEDVQIGNGNKNSEKIQDLKLQHVKKVLEKSVAKTDANPVIGIGRGEDYSKVTSEAIKNAGGLSSIIKAGDVVLIKPNLCIIMPEGSPQTTDYRVVQEVVNQVKQLGASKVIIAEGCFTGNAFDDANLKETKYGSIKDVEFFNFNDCGFDESYEIKPQNSLVGKALYVPKIFMDADVVISIPKLKTHSITTESLSLKNWIGVPSERMYGGSGNKMGLHNLGLNQVIVDLNKIRKPDFSVIDGIIGGEGNGPTGNTPVKSNIVFAGIDPVALDTVATTFMGIEVNSHILLAGENGLGISDLSKINIVGANLDQIKMKFKSF